MQVKKYTEANLEKRKGAYFSIGLLFVMAMVYCLFELKFYDLETADYKQLHLDLIEAEVVPITQASPPPPPPPPRATTQIQIVADHEEIIIELEIEDLEIDDDSQIEIRVIEVIHEIEEEEIEEEDKE